MSGSAFPDPGQTLKISIDVSTEAFWECLPFDLNGCLDWRFDQPLRWPARYGDVCVPGSGQETPEGVVSGLTTARPVADEPVNGNVIDLGRRDVVRGAVPHERR